MHASIRFALNGFSPINQRLPPEALALVPSFLVRDRDRITATHVCRHWRDTFLSTPALWDVVTASDNPDKTITYLERSGDVPLDVSIAHYGIHSTGWDASFQALNQHSHRFRALKFYKYRRSKVDVLAIMDKPFPLLTELEFTIVNVEQAERSQGPYRFPSLNSLILHGDIVDPQWFPLTNLRKLVIGHCGWGFRPLRLLGHLAKAPLLEELELAVDEMVSSDEFGENAPPVELKHLKRMVFRGTLPQGLRSLISRIAHPHDTKFVITCDLYIERKCPISHRLPQATRLPILTTPKSIRCQLVHDEESSTTRACIDLISTDGRHILIQNRYGWPEDFTLNEIRLWDLAGPCFEFTTTIDLSFVERLCFEGCSPSPGVVQELLEAMGKLETLVVVCGNPVVLFMAMERLKSPAEICPLLRRLVVRNDVDGFIRWEEMVQFVRTRAAGGSTLDQVTLTSSFSELPGQHADSVALLEEVTEVRYDLGRNTVGWEWWKE